MLHQRLTLTLLVVGLMPLDILLMQGATGEERGGGTELLRAVALQSQAGWGDPLGAEGVTPPSLVGTLLTPTPRNFVLWPHKTQRGCSRGGEGPQLASTHPSSGRVNSVRSFHSAQKASLRSQFSSDNRQLSSEVAMISLTPSAPLLPGPLNRPPSPSPRGYFQPLWCQML